MKLMFTTGFLKNLSYSVNHYSCTQGMFYYPDLSDHETLHWTCVLCTRSLIAKCRCHLLGSMA